MTSRKRCRYFENGIEDPTPDEKIAFIFEPEDSEDILASQNGSKKVSERDPKTCVEISERDPKTQVFEPDEKGSLVDFILLDVPKVEQQSVQNLSEKIREFGEICIERIRAMKELELCIRNENIRLQKENDVLRKALNKPTSESFERFPHKFPKNAKLYYSPKRK